LIVFYTTDFLLFDCTADAPEEKKLLGPRESTNSSENQWKDSNFVEKDIECLVVFLFVL
jgi:hypothetical protein